MIRRVVTVANLFYAVALVILGVVPNIPGINDNFSDLVAHTVAAALQAWLLFALFRQRMGPGRAAWLAAIVAAVYGGLIEVLQLFQPARQAELSDAAANSFGAAAAATVAFISHRRPRLPESG